MHVRGLVAALNASGKYKYKARLEPSRLPPLMTFLLSRQNRSSTILSSVEVRPENQSIHASYPVAKLAFSGVVGLAIARRLSLSYPDKSTFLVERHSRAGEETRYTDTVYFRCERC